MSAVLAFAVLLLIGCLLSGLADRSVLSLAVLFLIAGTVLAAFGVLSMSPTDPVVARLSEYALFAVLFTDGMRLRFRDLPRPGHLPGRALLFGLPLTLAAIAAAAHWITGLPWIESFLIGAVLSPTDPVLVSAIVGAKSIPARLRHLLNVESGLNDGLALPIVVALLAVLSHESVRIPAIVGEVVGGIAVGIGVALAGLKLAQMRVFGISEKLNPLLLFSVGLTVLALCSIIGVNPFLAAFAAGLTASSCGPGYRDDFLRFGELLTEIFKLAALFVFGALLTPSLLSGSLVHFAAFTAFTLIVARPAGLALALVGTDLRPVEFWTAAWFGPKGFASVLYSLLVLQSGIHYGPDVFRLTAVVVAASIIAHSSTDVPFAKWFRRQMPPEKEQVPASEQPADQPVR